MTCPTSRITAKSKRNDFFSWNWKKERKMGRLVMTRKKESV
jgi:hypothetical protein